MLSSCSVYSLGYFCILSAYTLCILCMLCIINLLGYFCIHSAYCILCRHTHTLCLLSCILSVYSLYALHTHLHSLCLLWAFCILSAYSWYTLHTHLDTSVLTLCKFSVHYPRCCWSGVMLIVREGANVSGQT